MSVRMSVFQVWHLCLCLTSLLRWDVCYSQRHVQIQKGPLYRVKGFPMSISCSVSGFKGSSVQDFQFTVKRDIYPNIDANMISTRDPSFAYAVFSSRVENKEIEIVRVSGSSVLLKINSVEMNDAGLYTCHTPNTDGEYHGIYGAETKLNVMEDTLVASYSGSASLNASEGDSLQLECHVSSHTSQHSHVSVSWFLHREDDTDPRPIITLDRDLTVKPGDGFAERYRSELIRMDKVENTTFRLKMLEVQRSDSGNIYCEVIQWIQDPDHLWTQIAHKTTTRCHVDVKAVESELAVVMLMEKDHVMEGERLRVVCSVSGFTGALSVSWQHKTDSEDSFSDIINLTHDGVMEETDTRYHHRDIHTSRSSDGNITLDINEVMTSDAGQYKCIVSEWIPQNNGMMKKANSQAQKNISVKAVDLKVTLRGRDANVTLDSPVDLICTVRGPKVPLAVNWMFMPLNPSTWTNIVSINHTGEIIWASEQRSYQLSVQMQASGVNFALRIMRSSRRQEGKYMCKVDTYQKNIKKTSKNSNLLAVTVRKPVSKLTLSRPRSSLESTVNTDVKIECSVIKTSTNSSRFKIIWMFRSEMLLTMDTDAVVRFGPAAGLEMDQRFGMEKKERQTFMLSILQVRTSDSGQYRCEVEEWLQDPLGDWYPLHKQSVSTQLLIKNKESDFRMNKINTQLMVEEGDPLTLKCLVDGVGSDSSLRYSLTWFFIPNRSSSVPLLTYSYDGRLKYNDNDDGRFQFSSSEVGSFLLIFPRSVQEDSGRYYCQVLQYQLDCKDQWTHKASGTSGSTNVSVHPLESKLKVQKEDRMLNVTNLHAGFTVDCVIDARSSDTSVFEVTWSRGLREEHPIIIFNASRDGTLHSAVSDKELLFRRPSATHYKLTVPNINPTDAGLYRCQVVEWMRTAPNHWRRIGEDTSGELSVYVETEDKEKENTFTIDMNEKQLNIKEGESFQLACSLNERKEDPTLRYTLRWVFNSPNSSSGISLLEYLNDGRLEYHVDDNQRKDRLRFSRPSRDKFNLVVLNSDTADDGRYQCILDQYQLNCDGSWKQMTSAKSGFTNVSVHTIESKLHVQKQHQTLNITKLPADFTINCEIQSRSSNKSAFEVTWFKRQEQEQPIIIFTAKSDGTLDNTFSEKNLVFGRPRVRLYTLTVPNISPADMGQYYCQVDEWLLTSANIWRKMASTQSGELSVHIHTKGETEKQKDLFGISLGVFIPLICFLALLIVILLRREHKTRSDLKKKKECMWSENNPLNPVAVKTEAKGDLSS